MLFLISSIHQTLQSISSGPEITPWLSLCQLQWHLHAPAQEMARPSDPPLWEAHSPWMAAPCCRPRGQLWDLMLGSCLLTVLVAWGHFWRGTAAATHLMGKHDMTVLS